MSHVQMGAWPAIIMVFHFNDLRLQHYHEYKRRTRRKLTKSRLAEELGTHAATLAKLQRGESSTVSIELLDRACLFFECGVDKLMTPTLPKGTINRGDYGEG